MTDPLHASESASHGEVDELPSLDYNRIRSYWSQARPSVLGPYMLEGFGFPVTAGHFRFRGERRIVERLTARIRSDACVLDLGSGVGMWTEHFARSFGKVVSVEASPVLFETLQRRCSQFANVETVHADVLSYWPPADVDLVFLGGLLMYLNEEDVRTLLRRLVDCLKPGGLILCRESTVRQGTVVHRADYQVVYRSPETYRRIFEHCGLYVESAEANIPYIFGQMQCELIKGWKALVPRRLHCIPVVGRVLYWCFRLGYPWNVRLIPRVFELVGRPFPVLSNHFFLVRAAS